MDEHKIKKILDDLDKFEKYIDDLQEQINQLRQQVKENTNEIRHIWDFIHGLEYMIREK